MYGTLIINSSVAIHEGCDIAYNVQGSDDVFVNVSGETQPFELYFQSDALRTFLALGNAALAEMDALADREEAEYDARRADHDRPTEQRT